MGPDMRGMDVVVSPGEDRWKRGDDIQRIPTSPALNPALKLVPRQSLKAILKSSSRPPQDLLRPPSQKPPPHTSGRNLCDFAILRTGYGLSRSGKVLFAGLDPIFFQPPFFNPLFSTRASRLFFHPFACKTRGDGFLSGLLPHALANTLANAFDRACAHGFWAHAHGDR